MIDALKVASTGVGPGNSLVQKLEEVEADLAVGDVRGACNDLLNGYINTVQAHSGRKIDTAVADALIADAIAIGDVLECTSPPPAPLTGLVAVIPLALGAWLSVRRRLFGSTEDQP